MFFHCQSSARLVQNYQVYQHKQHCHRSHEWITGAPSDAGEAGVPRGERLFWDLRRSDAWMVGTCECSWTNEHECHDVTGIFPKYSSLSALHWYQIHGFAKSTDHSPDLRLLPLLEGLVARLQVSSAAFISSCTRDRSGKLKQAMWPVGHEPMASALAAYITLTI